MYQLRGGKNQFMIKNADKAEKTFIRVVLVGAEAGNTQAVYTQAVNTHPLAT